MSTPASIARHPLHPILVSVPIGLWSFAVVADLVYHLGWGSQTWKDVAFYCIGGGIVGALLAAVPGFIDFLSITVANVRKIGLFHMVVNLIAVALYAVSFALRWRGDVGPLPFAISLVGFLTVGVGGWLGGELVYVHNMGVQPPKPARQPEEGARRRIA
jgi:uncharacterized membrane protein